MYKRILLRAVFIYKNGGIRVGWAAQVLIHDTGCDGRRNGMKQNSHKSKVSLRQIRGHLLRSHGSCF